jgi:hypothetical protein
VCGAKFITPMDIALHILEKQNGLSEQVCATYVVAPNFQST